MPFLNIDRPKINLNRLLEFDVMNEGNQDGRLDQPYILDLITLDRLYFQSIPLEIVDTSESQFIAVAGPGRNNPNYHFTGSEDVISFTITWYANHSSKQDVIRKCKWLRSLSKNDGYDNEPHKVKFVMGHLYKDSKFIVTAAPYRLSLFDRSMGMLPTLATQEIELRRVTDTNLKRSDILKLST